MSAAKVCRFEQQLVSFVALLCSFSERFAKHSKKNFYLCPSKTLKR